MYGTKVDNFLRTWAPYSTTTNFTLVDFFMDIIYMHLVFSPYLWMERWFSKIQIVFYPLFPFLGATPYNGIVCDEDTSGIAFTQPETWPLKNLSLPNFCLHETDGKFSLKKSHSFYFQVQGQLMVTGVNFCDFLVFTRNEIHIKKYIMV